MFVDADLAFGGQFMGSDTHGLIVGTFAKMEDQHLRGSRFLLQVVEDVMLDWQRNVLQQVFFALRFVFAILGFEDDRSTLQALGSVPLTFGDIAAE